MGRGGSRSEGSRCQKEAVEASTKAADANTTRQVFGGLPTIATMVMETYKHIYGQRVRLRELRNSRNTHGKPSKLRPGMRNARNAHGQPRRNRR